VTEREKMGAYLLKIRECTPSKEYNKEHISQQELADNNTGLTKYFIGTVERGEANPTLNKLILLAKSLDQKKVTLFNVQIDVQKYTEELNK
jgi:transcriptional regulator with XRE-family HTH domain